MEAITLSLFLILLGGSNYATYKATQYMEHEKARKGIHALQNQINAQNDKILRLEKQKKDKLIEQVELVKVERVKLERELYDAYQTINKLEAENAEWSSTRVPYSIAEWLRIRSARTTNTSH
jgi:septal ring factor EnvC (AmiA/AmiB activator)